jgi:putative tryptophan/tyrosine transport system substrate-binding protein
MRRREFIALVGGAAAWPLAARAQQPAMPVIAVLSSTSSTDKANAPLLGPGLQASGYVEGRNVTIEYHWADGHYDKLPSMALDLVRRNVTLIYACLGPATLAAKAATTTVPIVFAIGGDPVQLGVVASVNRPGGNVTGVTSLAVELGAKQLEVLTELVPTATVVALLVNPTNPTVADTLVRELQTAARIRGVELHVLHASTESDLDTVFETLPRLRAGALVVGTDAFFNSRPQQIAALAARYAVPTMYPFREYVAAGGLVSYGESLTNVYRIAGVYSGRILKGAKPADLPVQQSTKVELIINLKTAKALGITVPLTLRGRADEVIE